MALTWMRAIVAAMLLPHCAARAARPAGLKALLLRTRAGASSSASTTSSSTSALHMASSTSTTSSTTTSPAAAADKLAALRRALAASQVDCFIVPTDDPHMSEYTALHYNRREWLSGFTGSAGTAVVTQTDALLFTDGRYHNQAELELPKDHWTLMRQGLKEVRHCAGELLFDNTAASLSCTHINLPGAVAGGMDRQDPPRGGRGGRRPLPARGHRHGQDQGASLPSARPRIIVSTVRERVYGLSPLRTHLPRVF